MKNIWKLVAACVIISICLTGCWSRRELNQLAIAAAVGIDKVDGQYMISAQIVNPNEIAAAKGGGSRSPVVTYKATGATVFEALRKITTQSPRQIYLSHLRIVVIGEALAREGIGKAMDFLSRDEETRSDFYIVVARDANAEDVLELLTSPEKIPANHLFNSLENSAKSWAATSKITLDELISDINSDGKAPILTGIRIVGDKDRGKSNENLQRTELPALLHYSGMAVLKKDKLVGWLDEPESKGYNYTQDNVKSTIVTLSCPDGNKIAVELIRTKASVTGSIHRGEPSVTVVIRAEANLAEDDCLDMDLTKTKTITELEIKTEKDITDKIDKAVEKAQHTYHSDIFGFGETLHRAAPGAWKAMSRNWDKQFEFLPVNVKVDVKIRRIGTISNPIRKQ